MVQGSRCILVVDDEAKMVRAIRDFLKIRGFRVLEALDGEEAMRVYYEHNNEIDLILLDVMLPKFTGFEVLENIRLNGSLVPIVMLTAKGEEYDQLNGFDLGADDYIVKPFSPSLLLARIEAVLKRVGTNDEISLDKVTINISRRTVEANGVMLDFKKREFDLLYFLMANAGQAFSREQLLKSVWGFDFDGDIRTVDTHVKQIRIKLGELSSYIKTIHRVGYKFEI